MPGKLPCTYPGCNKTFKSQSGRTYHVNAIHVNHNIVPGTSSSGSGPTQPAGAPAQPTRRPTAATSGPSPPVHDDFGLDEPDYSFTPHSQSPVPETPASSSSRPFASADTAPRGPRKIFHPHLNGRPCDINGNYLPEGTPPPPRTDAPSTDWHPFEDSTQFRTADFLYRKAQMSATNIDELMEIWALSMAKHDDLGPFASYTHMYDTIDSIELGDAPWRCFSTRYQGEVSEDSPSWKKQEFEVWYRDLDTVTRILLDHPDFDGQMDYAPYIDLDRRGKRRWNNFMSGNYAWKQSDKIYQEDPDTEGAMYCGIIGGADKTTVSVATGHVEYHPFYVSYSNPHNTIRRGHRNAVVPAGFLAIPKGDRKYDNDPEFRKFRKQLYHASISTILKTLQHAMVKPVVRRCPDGHYRRVIFDLAAFIADYPEQVVLSGIAQNWCPKCTAKAGRLDESPNFNLRTRGFTEQMMDTLSSKELWDDYGIDDYVIPFTYDFPRACIHEILTPDLLHQLIKGTFKDHLVTWVGDYLKIVHGEAKANEILDDIDHRIATVPSFPNQRRFPHGRRFKQWTGDDSKALMKVYLPAISGHVPTEMVQAIAAFLDACYIARRSDLDEESLAAFDAAVKRYHNKREIFRTSGVRPEGFSLPRQHSLLHYRRHIESFGAPNGVCSTITESRHITAVKKPWRRSNHYEALGQMLLTNRRLEKLAAARVDFEARGMLAPSRAAPPPPPPPTADDILRQNEEDEGGPTDTALVNSGEVSGTVTLARTRARKVPRDLDTLGNHIGVQMLSYLTRRFLHDQLVQARGEDGPWSEDVPEKNLPRILSKISVFRSAVATFYAPSDESGIRGMRRERIRSSPNWRNKSPRYDTAFVVEDESEPGMKGMRVVRVKLFFSFRHEGREYPCALIEWFKRVGRSPDPDIRKNTP